MDLAQVLFSTQMNGFNKHYIDIMRHCDWKNSCSIKSSKR